MVFSPRRPLIGALCAVGLLVVFPAVVRAWTPTTPQVTVTAFGESANDAGYATVTDTPGNVYSTGEFAGTVDFDLGVGVSSATSVGSRDVYVTKSDASGNLIWVKTFGGTSDDIGLSIAVDSSSNVYVSGSFRSTADLDPGANTLSFTSSGGQDAFVSKFDSSGGLLWVRQMGGSTDDRARSIVLDSVGNVFIAGYFQGTADFDPGVGTTNLTVVGSQDGYVWKLNSSGDLVWVRQLGGSSIDNMYSIAIGSNGDLVISGSFMSTVDFDPGAGTNNLTAVGAIDAFVLKLNSSGAFVWVSQLGGTGTEQGFAVAVDAAGNAYATGPFQGTVDVDPGVGTTNLTSAGAIDAFVWKLNSTGALVWAGQLGGTGSDSGAAIALDSSSNVYLAGYFQVSADFDPGVGTTTLTSAGGQDVYILKLDTTGAFVWVRQVGGTGNDIANAVFVDGSTSSYITGSFQGTADFDPDTATTNLMSVGLSDVFMLKLDSLGYSAVPTSSTSSTTSTTVVTTTTTPTNAPTTSVASGGVSAAASTSTTTVVGHKDTVTTTGIPVTGGSPMSYVLWSGLLLVLGAVLQLRVRQLTRCDQFIFLDN